MTELTEVERQAALAKFEELGDAETRAYLALAQWPAPYKRLALEWLAERREQRVKAALASEK